MRDALVLIACWVGLLWLLEVVDTLSGHALDTFGITPRVPSELADVIPAAFVHFGFAHLMANTVPLFVLGFLAAVRGLVRFIVVVVLIMLVSGLGVWLAAPSGSVTAGASGVIFGLFGYLLLRGFVDRRPVDIVLGVLVGLIYGSILWGVLPTAPGVSWQAHFFGLVGGLLAAILFRSRSAAGPRLSRR